VKSRASVAGHPLHPALVALPIGCFFLVLVGDVAHARTDADFWYTFSFVCLGAGILTALAAAAAGLVDYFGVKMSEAGGRVATIHLVLNLTCVALYALNWVLRRHEAALHTARWALVFGLEVVTFLALGVSGWLGGRIVFENKVGVLENEDPEATEIGRREGTHKQRPRPGGNPVRGSAPTRDTAS
jgi:uncharacterized membrane protein